eukprot:TRINITY_DN11415_c0_g1_i1.p1 TRINITY_DN11415_c0_g1~~TRINITY_DN11415_c0_g1_i1.p1  ORF type:complete len:871 (+),score=366.00 TRINITY_DN11415_c0_g1_i1:72-2684(+)
MDDIDRKESKKVTVAVRIRPGLDCRGERYEVVTVKKSEQNVCVCVNPTRFKEQTGYCFDHIFEQEDTQEDVYKMSAADMAVSTLEGRDNVILTYGQTGSGKTFTLLGQPLRPDGGLEDDSGIFLRILNDLLAQKELCRETHHLVISLSIIEIYNDQLKDLLNGKVNLTFKEHGDDMIVCNATMKSIESKSDLRFCFERAMANRAVAPTLMNNRSSRSHAMFIVDLLQQIKTPENPNPPDPRAFQAYQAGSMSQPPGTTPFCTPRMSKGYRTTSPQSGLRSARGDHGHDGHPPSARESIRGGYDSARSRADSTSNLFMKTENIFGEDSAYPITRSRLTMVDLAGSERAKKSGAQGSVLAEAVAVNKSLTTLGKVVNSICANSKHVPFRESKLTRILRPSLVGEASRMLLIANVAPTESSYAETLSTLHFADRIQGMKIPTGSTFRVADSEKEADYLRCLRSCEELTTELRIVKQLYPGFQQHLLTKPRLLLPAPPVANDRSYLQLHHRLDEASKGETNAKLREMVAALVGSMEKERPAIAAKKQRIEELERQLQAEQSNFASSSEKIHQMEELLQDEQATFVPPHREFVEVSSQIRTLSEAQLAAKQRETELQDKIARLQSELDGFAAPLEENKKLSESLDEEEANLEYFSQMMDEKRNWLATMERLTTFQLEVEALSHDVDGLKGKEGDLSVQARQLTEQMKAMNEDDGGEGITKGVSPLAWYFEGVRNGVAFTSPHRVTTAGMRDLFNEGVKKKLHGIFERIAKEKKCQDEDGRQIFSLLSQVKLTQDDLMDVSEMFQDSEWGSLDKLQTQCHENDCTAFALRAFVLYPPATPLLERVQQGDLGVLEFVEIILKEWQACCAKGLITEIP